MGRFPKVLKTRARDGFVRCRVVRRHGAGYFFPVDADNLQLNFALIADTHIGNVFEINRLNLLSKGLKDIANATVSARYHDYCRGPYGKRKARRVSATLVVADKRTPKPIRYCWQPATTTFVGSVSGGNTGRLTNTGRVNILNSSAARWVKGPRTSIIIKIVNGFYFIVLNTEAVDSLKNHLSPEQVAWADGVLRWPRRKESRRLSSTTNRFPP